MKKLGLAMLAMTMGLGGSSAMMGNTVSQSAEVESSLKSQAVKPQEKPTEHKKVYKKGKVKHYYRGYGISPKEYGMRYVKRGTHKRTNI